MTSVREIWTRWSEDRRPTQELPIVRLADLDLEDDCKVGHPVLKADAVRWPATKYAGRVMASDSDPAIEIRVCPECGQTVAKEIR